MMNSEDLRSEVMGWEDTIDDGEERSFIILDEGDYEFKVANFSRENFPGSAKIKPGPKAALTLEVETDRGTATIKTDLILAVSLKWKVASFFRSIGMKKKGEELKMDWKNVTGKKGRAHIIQRKWTGNDGVERVSNDVDYYIDAAAPAAKPAPAKPAPPVEGAIEVDPDELPF